MTHADTIADITAAIATRAAKLKTPKAIARRIRRGRDHVGYGVGLSRLSQVGLAIQHPVRVTAADRADIVAALQVLGFAVTVDMQTDAKGKKTFAGLTVC